VNSAFGKRNPNNSLQTCPFCYKRIWMFNCRVVFINVLTWNPFTYHRKLMNINPWMRKQLR